MSDDVLVDRGRHRSAPDDPPSRWRRAARGRGLRQVLMLLVLAAACGGLCALYFHQSLTAPFNSDGAANVLQAQAIIHGNPLLRGWWTSDVSFYTTELPEYALVTAIHGVGPNVVHVCGALTYTLTVLLTALVARGRERGAAGYCRAGVAVGIVLALSVTGSIGMFLENPNHAGTAVPVLAVLLLLDRAGGSTGDEDAGDRGGRRWLIPVAACAVLALAEVGDELTLATATVPLGVVCVVRLAGGRLTGGRLIKGRLAGGRLTGGRLIKGRLITGDLASEGERRRAAVERALLAAAVVSVGLAWLANLLIRALGGFDLRPLAGVALAPLSRVPANASMLWQAIVLLFGANQPGTPHQPRMISDHVLVQLMAGFHVIGLLLAAAGLAAGIAALRSRRGDRVTQVLVVAIIVLLLFGVFSTLLRSRSYVHEIAILLPLSAALAGRVLVPLAGRRWPGRRFVRIAAVPLSAWLAAGVAEVGYDATWPAVQPSQQAVAAWLTAHHERDGLAGYWQAASTTVTSGGQVLVAAITLPASSAAPTAPTDPAAPASSAAPVAPAAPASSAAPAAPAALAAGGSTPGQAVSYRWESSADWYQPARHDATFVIAVTRQAPAAGLSVTQVRARFGRPAAQYQVGQDVIMLYDYNLLTRVAATAFPGP
ncbi:MAG TPA: hypothetical protein VGG54_02960 [Trebonia sp.]